MRKILKSTRRFSKQSGLVMFVALFAVAGIIALTITRAATLTSTVEPEGGALSGSARVISDSTASNSKAVQFIQATTGAYTPPALPGPSCASIAHGSGQWQAIDPSCVNIRDFNNPSSNYGAQTIQVAKSSPNVIVVGTNYQGLWRSTDRGENWTRLSNTIAEGFNGCNSFDGRNWTLAIDPTDPNIMYTVNGYGCYQGLWKTTDGGVTWHDALPQSVKDSATNDIYSVEFDPFDHNHILVGSHSNWAGGSKDAGVLETKNGGSTWTLRNAGGPWGHGHYVHFLDNSNTWIVGTQDNGFWRTTDGGSTWSQVMTNSMAHGMNQTYKSSTGAWYVTTVNSVAKSTNNGATWTTVFNSPCGDGFGGIIGDGTRMYVSPANTGASTCGQVKYYSALESSDTNWTAFGTQLFNDGPMNMAIDPTSRTIYSSNWNGGIWRLSY